MKSRPHVNSSKSHKIKRVRELTKEGDYLKEKFYRSKLSNNTDSIFGYKHFVKPEDKFKGYDRGFYEKLKNDNAKRWFACHCRDLELGEFKNGELNGYGARYSSDAYGYDMNDDVYDDLISQAGLIGKFTNGLPNGKMLYYDVSIYGSRCVALMIWSEGKLASFLEDYEDDNINIEDEILSGIFWFPGQSGSDSDYTKEKWWEKYKEEFLE